ncbi:hypothetical protein EYR36_002919 [Pleurotus pulmonarius]|nr:hypothetical protein EYR36_002919 [Pleurotus pulmonarius]
MIPNHLHVTSPARRAEPAWRIPVVNYEYIDASVGTIRRATAASCRASDEVKNKPLWSDALLLGQDLAKVSEELERVKCHEREAKAAQMRIGRLIMGATVQSYFGLMDATWFRKLSRGRGDFVGVGPLEMEVRDEVRVVYGAMVSCVEGLEISLGEELFAIV